MLNRLQNNSIKKDYANLMCNYIKRQMSICALEQHIKKLKSLPIKAPVK